MLGDLSLRGRIWKVSHDLAVLHGRHRDGVRFRILRTAMRRSVGSGRLRRCTSGSRRRPCRRSVLLLLPHYASIGLYWRWWICQTTQQECRKIQTHLRQRFRIRHPSLDRQNCSSSGAAISVRRQGQEHVHRIRSEGRTEGSEIAQGHEADFHAERRVNVRSDGKEKSALQQSVSSKVGWVARTLMDRCTS